MSPVVAAAWLGVAASAIAVMTLFVLAVVVIVGALNGDIAPGDALDAFIKTVQSLPG